MRGGAAGTRWRQDQMAYQCVQQARVRAGPHPVCCSQTWTGGARDDRDPAQHHKPHQCRVGRGAAAARQVDDPESFSQVQFALLFEAATPWHDFASTCLVSPTCADCARGACCHRHHPSGTLSTAAKLAALDWDTLWMRRRRAFGSGCGAIRATMIW